MRVRKEAYSPELHPFFAETGVPYCQKGSEFVVLREKGGAVLSAGITWKNDVHPMRRYLYVSTHPHHRRRGLASAVYAALQMLHPDAQWQGMIDSENEEAAKWLSSMGFECARKCYTVDVNCLDLRERPALEMELTPFCELSVEQMTCLLTMLRADYAAKHEHVSPLNEAYDEAVFGMYVMKNVDLRQSVCRIENGQITAYVCCYDGEERYTREVGCMGQRMESREKYRRFLLNFADMSFETAGGLIIEADDCDSDAMELLSLFEVVPEDSFDTYITQ